MLVMIIVPSAPPYIPLTNIDIYYFSTPIGSILKTHFLQYSAEFLPVLSFVLKTMKEYDHLWLPGLDPCYPHIAFGKIQYHEPQ